MIKIVITKFVCLRQNPLVGSCVQCTRYGVYFILISGAFIPEAAHIPSIYHGGLTKGENCIDQRVRIPSSRSKNRAGLRFLKALIINFQFFLFEKSPTAKRFSLASFSHDRLRTHPQRQSQLTRSGGRKTYSLSPGRKWWMLREQ